MPKNHLWCPSVCTSEGGIEYFLFRMAKALREIFGERNFTVLVRNDSAKEVHAALGTEVTNDTPAWWPRPLWSLGFALMVVVRALRRRPDLIVTTHLSFAPFAAFVRKLVKVPYWVVLHGYESWEIERPSPRRAAQVAAFLSPGGGFTRKG